MKRSEVKLNILSTAGQQDMNWDEHVPFNEPKQDDQLDNSIQPFKTSQSYNLTLYLLPKTFCLLLDKNIYLLLPKKKKKKLVCFSKTAFGEIVTIYG